MSFVYYDLGSLGGDEVVEVSLDRQANVKLLDSYNFAQYRNARQHTFYGGKAIRSPIRIPVPGSGHWHLAIDLGRYAGSIRSGVRLINE